MGKLLRKLSEQMSRRRLKALELILDEIAMSGNADDDRDPGVE